PAWPNNVCFPTIPTDSLPVNVTFTNCSCGAAWFIEPQTAQPWQLMALGPLGWWFVAGSTLHSNATLPIGGGVTQLTVVASTNMQAQSRVRMSQLHNNLHASLSRPVAARTQGVGLSG